MSTNVQEFLGDLDGGVLEEKLSTVLSDVAAAVIATGSAGKVTLQMSFKQIGNSSQV